MFTYTLRRLAFAVPTVLVISLVVFLMLDMAPGDPTASLPLTIPLEVREEIRAALGLGEPVVVRYVKWLHMMVINEPLHMIARSTGWDIAPDGPRILSWQTRSPVGDIIVQRIPQTLWVVGLGYLFGILIALPIGVISAYRQYSWFDQAGTFVSMVGFSVPVFVIGYLLAYIFALELDWLPVQGYTPIARGFWPFLENLILPTIALGSVYIALIARITRATMLEVLAQDYVRTAKAKGLGTRPILFLHALKNAAVPISTVIGIGIALLIGGAVVTESVFAIPGLGRLTVDAILRRDYPVIQGVVLLFSFVYVLVNLMIDLLYTVFDPRIRY